MQSDVTHERIGVSTVLVSEGAFTFVPDFLLLSGMSTYSNLRESNVRVTGP